MKQEDQFFPTSGFINLFSTTSLGSMRSIVTECTQQIHAVGTLSFLFTLKPVCYLPIQDSGEP